MKEALCVSAEVAAADASCVAGEQKPAPPRLLSAETSAGTRKSDDFEVPLKPAPSPRVKWGHPTTFGPQVQWQFWDSARRHVVRGCAPGRGPGGKRSGGERRALVGAACVFPSPGRANGSAGGRSFCAWPKLQREDVRHRKDAGTASRQGPASVRSRNPGPSGGNSEKRRPISRRVAPCMY